MKRDASGIGRKAALLTLLFVAAGCADSGRKLSEPVSGPPPQVPFVTSLVPGRTVAGDSVIIEGGKFGSEQSSSVVSFSSTNERLPATVIPGQWSDTRVGVLVPAGATTGAIVVQVKGEASNEMPFEVAPRLVSYSGDLLPIFDQYGCSSCHGGEGRLFVHPHAALMGGTSDHGPVVRRRHGGESVLVQKLGTPPPFRDRMPQGSAPLPEDRIQTIRDWIDQGARDN